MKTLGSFGYVAPSGVSEVLDILERHRGGCQVLAGGTDLLVLLRKRALTAELLVDVKRTGSELDLIRVEADGLHIGAACTIAELERSPLVGEHAPLLKKAVFSFGNAQVRNRATVGGNICRSSPAGDTLPALLVLDASVHLRNKEGQRVVALTDFVTGPGQNCMTPGELLTEVIVPPAPDGRLGDAFEKVMRTAEDLSKLSAAVRLALKDNIIADARVAVGSVAPIPKRLWGVEAVLKGKHAVPAVLAAAAAETTAEIAPTTDVRSTKDYRLRTTHIFVRRALEAALAEARL